MSTIYSLEPTQDLGLAKSQSINAGARINDLLFQATNHGSGLLGSIAVTELIDAYCNAKDSTFSKNSKDYT